jgi:hypothetical protein
MALGELVLFSKGRFDRSSGTLGVTDAFDASLCEDLAWKEVLWCALWILEPHIKINKALQN